MERKKRYRNWLILIFLISLAGLGTLCYKEEQKRIPDSFTQTEGERVPEYSSIWVTAEVVPDLTEASASPGAPWHYTISYEYLGFIPLKEAEVEVIKPAYVIPGGIPVGIYLETDGILVLGTGEVTGMDGLNYEPAFQIVQGGDYIQAVNGQAVMEKEELIEFVQEAGGEEVVLDVNRNGEEIQVKLEPVQTGSEEYKLGIWVRDNTQGVGTLTFLTEDREFGALGHGVSDADTGVRLNLSKGKLYDTDIIDIKKGEKGSPGEISGLIRYRSELVCGELTANTPVGIFGTAHRRLYDQIPRETIQIAYKQEIELGEAWVRSSIDGTLRDYQVEITEINSKDTDINKGIVLKVTDPELLYLAGGIVQGMSGSPIIQNGKLVGAVTHVCVNL